MRIAVAVIGDVERLHVPRRHDVLRAEADAETADHLERCRVDDADGARDAVGHVDARQGAGDGRAEIGRARVSIEVDRRCHGIGGSGRPARRLRRFGGRQLDDGAASAARWRRWSGERRLRRGHRHDGHRRIGHRTTVSDAAEPAARASDSSTIAARLRRSEERRGRASPSARRDRRRITSPCCLAMKARMSRDRWSRR